MREQRDIFPYALAVTFFVAIALFVAAWLSSDVYADETVTIASVSACAGLDIRFHESIPCQGFFCTATPKAHWTVVRDALNEAVDADHQFAGNERDYEAFHFNFAPVCELAKRQGLRRLWIGCHGDTDLDKSDYYSSSLARSGEEVELVTSRCVISKFQGQNPGWGDLIDHPLLRAYDDREDIFKYERDNGAPGRYDVLADQDRRKELYERSLRAIAGNYEYDLQHPDSPGLSSAYRGPHRLDTGVATCEHDSGDAVALLDLPVTRGERRLGEQR